MIKIHCEYLQAWSKYYILHSLPLVSPLKDKRWIGLSGARIMHMDGVACVGSQLSQCPLAAANTLSQSGCGGTTAQSQGTVVRMAYHKWVSGRNVTRRWGNIRCGERLKKLAHHDGAMKKPIIYLKETEQAWCRLRDASHEAFWTKDQFLKPDNNVLLHSRDKKRIPASQCLIP